MHLLALATLLATQPAAAPGDSKPKRFKAGAQLETGMEYDSNATRREAAAGDPVQTGLWRTQAKAWIRGVPLRRLALAASYQLAGKLYVTAPARGQDALIQRLTAAAGMRIAEPLVVRLAGVYHEGFQRRADLTTEAGGILDFRLLDGSVALSLAGGPAGGGAPQRSARDDWHWSATLSLGLRRFWYKPVATLGFRDVYGAMHLEYQRQIGPRRKRWEMSLQLGYAVALRGFEASRELYCPADIVGCERTDPDAVLTFPDSTTSRRDLVHRFTAEATFVRRVLLEFGYGLLASRSNSYGLSFLRHDVSGKVVGRLPGQIYGTLKVTIRLSRYELPTLPLGVIDPQLVGFDSENRSAVLAQLERTIWKPLAVVVRYTLFLGDVTSPQFRYLRHLVFFGLALRHRS